MYFQVAQVYTDLSNLSFECLTMNHQQFVLASNNIGKLKELGALLAPLKIQLTPQANFNIESVAETGLSFVENALIKARHAAKISKLPAIADDSGLVVPALDGAPGIYSARFSGKNATDIDNINHLLERMQNIEQRQAYFYCALVYIAHPLDPTPLISTARFEGEISHSINGTGGFGYDPIFYLPGHKQTAAEISQQEKNTISHRAKASQQLFNLLREKCKC